MLDAGAHRLEMINMNISSRAEGERNGTRLHPWRSHSLRVPTISCHPSIRGSRRFNRRFTFVVANGFRLFICSANLMLFFVFGGATFLSCAHLVECRRH